MLLRMLKHVEKIDILLVEDILAMNNVLTKSWIINALWIAIFITITTFTVKSYSLINILL